jgi:hypothetical protein
MSCCSSSYLSWFHPNNAQFLQQVYNGTKILRLEIHGNIQINLQGNLYNFSSKMNQQNMQQAEKQQTRHTSIIRFLFL